MMDIAEVAKSSGLPASTLRFYEEKGLIQSTGRQGLRRIFHLSVLDRLALISLARNTGFALDEISQLLSKQTAGSKQPDIDRNLLRQKADELDKKIKELTAMRDGLRHAAVCDAPNHFECPKFLRLLQIAGKKPARQKNPPTQKHS